MNERRRKTTRRNTPMKRKIWKRREYKKKNDDQQHWHLVLSFFFLSKKEIGNFQRFCCFLSQHFVAIYCFFFISPFVSHICAHLSDSYPLQSEYHGPAGYEKFSDYSIELLFLFCIRMLVFIPWMPKRNAI